MSTQMLRIQSYGSNKVAGIIGEADRRPEYCKHVDIPKPPFWLHGSATAVNNAVEVHMKTMAKCVKKNGKEYKRKRRIDHRCLLAGFASWPKSLSEIAVSLDEKSRFRAWCLAVHDWLKEQFGEQLHGNVLHVDESHLHLHFFIVGDANLLHPGLKEEFVDGHRLTSGRVRHERHVAGLRSFQDSYHEVVGSKFGLERRSENPSGPRIADRQLAKRLADLEKCVAALDDAEIQKAFDNLRALATYKPF